MERLEPFSLLTPEEKNEAVRCYWDDPDTDHEEDFNILARHGKARPIFVRKQPKETILRTLLGIIQKPKSPWPAKMFLRPWLLAHHRPMLATFLDALGVPHQNALIVEDVPTPPTAEAFLAATATLRDRGHDHRKITIYLLTVYDEKDPFWAPLWPAIETHRNLGRDPSTAEPGLPLPAETAEDPPVTAPAEAVGEGAANYTDHGFTPLESVLIHAIVASAAGLEGALEMDDTRTMIQDLLKMSPRPRLQFIKGFGDGISLSPVAALGMEETPDRRGWYLVGWAIGTFRHGHEKEILEQFRNQRGVLMELQTKGSAWGVMLLGTFWELWLDFMSPVDFSHILETQGSVYEPRRFQLKVLRPLLDHLSAKYRDGDATILPVLLSMEATLTAPGGPKAEDPQARALLTRIRRRIGQCHQLMGHFPQAREIFRALLEGGVRDVAGDLGLVEAGFQHLFDVPPPESPGDWPQHTQRLIQGEASFLKAVESDPPTINALLALGVLRFLQGQPARAKQWLVQAEAQMVQSPYLEAYREVHLLSWVRLLGAISIFESLDTTLVHLAETMAVFALENPPARPRVSLNLVARLVGAAGIGDGPTKDHLARLAFEKHGHTLWRHLGADPSVLNTHEMRTALLEWLPNSNYNAERRYTNLAKVLERALADEDMEQARDILGDLESLAMEHAALGQQWLDLLEHSEKLDPAWSSLDVARSRSLLFGRSGRSQDAAEALMVEFYRLKDMADPVSRAHLAELMAFFKECRLDEARLEDLARQIELDPPVPGRTSVQTRLEQGLELKLLFVGGNETQAQYDRAVQSELSAKWPGVKVEFMHTGFSSNWQPFVDDVRRKLPHTHALGLSYLIRTNFGRTVRALCSSEKPWFPCTGKGKESILRTLKSAALWAAERPRPNPAP